MFILLHSLMDWLQKSFSNVPNTLTSLRVFSTPLLLVLAYLGLKFWFGIAFLVFGATDAFDGYFARKLKQTSEFGAWYDGFADNLWAVAALFWLYWLTPSVITSHLIILCVLGGLFVLDLGIGYLKYRCMVHYHLWSSKLAAIALYCYICMLMLWHDNAIAFYVTIGIAILSVIEEIACTLKGTQMQANKKSIFSAARRP